MWLGNQVEPLSAVAPFGHSSCLMGAVSKERTTVQSVCIPSSPLCDNCVISYQLPNGGPWTTDTLLLLTNKTLVLLTTKAFNAITPDKTNINTPDNQLLPWQPKRHYEEDKNSKRSGVRMDTPSLNCSLAGQGDVADQPAALYGPVRHHWIYSGAYPSLIIHSLGFPYC